MSDKVQHLLMINTLSKVGTWEFPQLDKNYQPTVNIISNDEKLEAFPLRSGTRPGYLLSSLLFNIILKVLGNTIRQEKR